MRGQSNTSPSGGSATCHIGIDLMGSDTKPDELLKAILGFAVELPPCAKLTFFGTQELFYGHPHPPLNISFHCVTEVITMDDNPLTAIRLKKNSSLVVGINMLKKHQINAFISAGNTGALTACAKINLSMLPGIERPALLALLPTRKSEIAVLDVGANTTYKAENLLQFAKMGIAYQKSRHIKNPRVGLLNIGAESTKGTPELREAHLLLESLPSFVGNIEARNAFEGDIDVLVTDGFTGNVFLKTAEGIATFILHQIEEAATDEASPHLKGMLTEIRHRVYYADYPGALLCGIDGILIKCHGNPTPQSIFCSITHAIRLINTQVVSKIGRQAL